MIWIIKNLWFNKNEVEYVGAIVCNAEQFLWNTVGLFLWEHTLNLVIGWM